MQDEVQRYIALKKQVLNRIFSQMNDVQREAVFTTKGPLLILAGAGSGKTTVLIHRIYYLIRFGDSYENNEFYPDLCEDDWSFLERCARGDEMDEERCAQLLAYHPVKPWNILAITFTNKAAGELRTRLAAKLSAAARDIVAATFHSACVQILRRNIARLGYNPSFTIYDTDDSLRVIRKQMDLLKISDKNLKPRTVLSAISRAKDAMLSPEELLQNSGQDFINQTAAKIYIGYQKELKAANAVDFDDIILLTVRLLEEHPDVLEYYQNRYRYIMVDEYQDTNLLQYRLISLLSGAHKNLCVVGDDDQSIYKFRGATIENILSFEHQFPGARVIRLEQNYRSTQTILDAANEVIKNNTERKGKNLWTHNGKGQKITVYRAENEQAEAAYICECIGKNIQNGEHFGDHAVLYRMNAQSNAIEREMTRNAIPYKMIGGLRFYERKEIKDAVSYLSVIHNPEDNLRFLRIINEPKRGIGAATVAAATQIAENLGLSLFEVFKTADEYASLSRKAASLMEFACLIDDWITDADEGMPLDYLFDKVMQQSGYLPALIAQGEVEQTRVENLEELKSNIQHYMQENEEATLSGFLEEIALYTDLDSYNDNEDRVVLMTIHSAKGLEFNHVFLSGAEEGIFPGSQSIYNPAEIEEERRLAYVAFTRAKKTLHVTCCASRMLFGFTSRYPISRFVREIPADLYEMQDALFQMHSSTPSVVKERPVINKAAPVSYNAPHRRLAGEKIMPKTSQAKNTPPLAAGDRVEHAVYGKGLVLSVRPMGGDRLVEIAFDVVGTKKVMANYAKLKKLDS